MAPKSGSGLTHVDSTSQRSREAIGELSNVGPRSV